MLGNIVTSLGKEDDHHEYTFGWFGGCPKTLLDQLDNALQNS